MHASLRVIFGRDRRGRNNFPITANFASNIFHLAIFCTVASTTYLPSTACSQTLYALIPIGATKIWKRFYDVRSHRRLVYASFKRLSRRVTSRAIETMTGGSRAPKSYFSSGCYTCRSRSKKFLSYNFRALASATHSISLHALGCILTNATCSGILVTAAS